MIWFLQDQVANDKVSIHKIKNKFNVADLLTKYLSKDEIAHIVDFLQHRYLEGRSRAAPELSLLDDQPLVHDVDLHVVLKDGRSQRCYCSGKPRMQ